MWFALWLEADPALTVDKIKDIMSSTAIKDNNVTEATVWGAGKVDAYNGIKGSTEAGCVGYCRCGCGRR